MKRALLVPVLWAAWALAPQAARSEEKPVEATGWVSDEACGAEHTKPGREDCVRKCLRGGASVGHPEWKPQRMVFVDDGGGAIWVVENPEALKGMEGAHVRVTSRLDTSAKTVHVLASEIIKEK
jgi:hypothetical protein